MRVAFSVEGHPPLRTQAGRSAGRSSPNADPLAQAGRTIIEKRPQAFPMEQPFGVTVVFGSTTPDAESEGYDPIDPILEILVDIGLIADERQARWQRYLQNPDAGERYSVMIEPVVA